MSLTALPVTVSDLTQLQQGVGLLDVRSDDGSGDE